MSMNEDKERLTHFDADGKAVMVDVSGKEATARRAVAEGAIVVSAPVMQAIVAGAAAKGDVLGVARVAGIMAVKRTADLIPLCHPLPIGRCGVDFEVDEAALRIVARCSVTVNGRTGVEMEALVGATTALLTIYDMTKALDKGMEITGVRLLEKSGGKGGDYVAGDGMP